MQTWHYYSPGARALDQLKGLLHQFYTKSTTACVGKKSSLKAFVAPDTGWIQSDKLPPVLLSG